MSPDDPRHGSHRGYILGCRSQCCANAHRIYMNLYRMGRRPRLIPSLGTVRRVQALLALGWTCADIGNAAGKGDEWARMVARSNTVTTTTAALVARAYDEMSMTVPTGWEHERTRRYYATKGYAPPLSWEDDTIDDPAAEPAGIGFHSADRAAALAELDGLQLGISTVCRRLDVSRKTLEKWCWRNDLSALFSRLVERESPRYWANGVTEGGVA